MGGGKETPRQKMIGLMYLVLMALLAMNVSKEIINAFVTLNNKIESSITNTESFNEDIIGNLDSKYATLVSTSGKENPETKRVAALIGIKDSIVYETRKMCNDLVARNLWMLIGAAKPDTKLDEIKDIEYAILDPENNPDALARLKALVIKINDLGFVAHSGEEVDHSDDPYHNDLFHITDDGFIHIKDVVPFVKDVNSKKQNFDINGILRPVITIPEVKPLDDLLNEMQQLNTQVAVIVDEYGTIEGLVTIEDILEYIVGPIEDEFDTENISSNITVLDNKVVAGGLVSIETFNNEAEPKLGHEIISEGSATLAGYVLELFDSLIPNEGDKISDDNYEYTISKQNGNRIEEIVITVKK